MGLLSSLAKPTAKEVISEMRQLIKSGAKPLYRHDVYPEKLFEQGFDTWATSSPKVNSGAEPIGLYFAKNLRDIHPLLNPGFTAAPREFFNRGHIAQPYSRPRGLTSGVLSPDAEHMEFNAPEWVEFLRGYMKEKGLPNTITETGGIGSSINSVPNLYGASKVRLAKGLTERLANMGLDAVTFPDTIAGQPNIKQTVLLSRGNMLARWQRGDVEGAGILGLLATPKFLGWTGEEQSATKER